MATLGEGLKFCSRPLSPREREIVVGALERWQRLDPDPAAQACMRALLRQQLLRAMDEPTFAGPAERATLGYTDEHGRILLNPRICFAAYHCLGRLHPSDVVRTTSVLVHEYRHHQLGEGEAQACQAEMRFLRLAWLRESDPGWSQEWQSWSGIVESRIRPHLGQEGLVPAGLGLRRPGKLQLAP